jgi:DNA-binding beta-propeller fold protein YncE
VGVSPDGARVFVTGLVGGFTQQDFGTAAYDATDGRLLWFARYDSVGNGGDYGIALAVSPDGNTVFVTGESGLNNYPTYGNYATVAYNAATGAQRWVAIYNGPGNRDDRPAGIRVSPDGTRLFVTGTSPGSTALGSDDYATVAYNTANGAQLWVARYNGPTNGNNEALDIAVNPRGTRVFVTGASNGTTTNADYATVAYDAAKGRERWVARYNGPGNGEDVANAVRVSPDGKTVLATGSSYGTTTGSDYATIAYNAANGKQRWISRYSSPGNNFDAAYGLGISPDGTKVFVTGRAGSAWDYGTVAYNAKDGTQLWAKGYNGPGNGNDTATSLGVSPDGTTVFVTGGSEGLGTSQDYATLAYNTIDGTQLWLTRYNSPDNGYDFPASLAVTPDGSTVFVTGGSGGAAPGEAYATVAYNVH